MAYSGQGQMNQQQQQQQPPKRQSVGEGGPPPKRFKVGHELSGDYSDAVRKKYQSASRTGQACDRCKERKMRCDANAAGCLACQQKNLRCVTTDRITGRATERGQAERLENELIALRRHLAAYANKYGSLEDNELVPTDPYRDASAASGYGTNRSRTFDPQNSYSTSVPGKDGPYYGPIHGTVVDMLQDEVDVAAFDCPAMAEFEYGTGPLFNHSAKSYVLTVSGAQRPEKPPMPSKEEALKYIEQYLMTVNTYVPVLHGPSTLTLARRLYDEPDFKVSRAEETIIILVLCNMYYQVAVRNPGAVATEKMKDSHHLFHYGLSLMCEFSRDSSLESMQALAMLLLHARCLPKPGNIWHFSTNILNRAIDLEYHRSPSKLGLRASDLALEMRKRVFWAILGITIETAAKLGRPMPLRMEDIDVELPIALEDFEISESGIAPSRSGVCTFRAGRQFWKLQPLLIDLYNNFVSVRRPSPEYLRNLEVLSAKIIEYRQQWTTEICMEPESGSNTVATLHVDSWAAEFQLILHHPRLCTANSPEVMEHNLVECHKAAARLLDNANKLFSRFRGVDFTWYSTVGYVLALGITLHIHSVRKDQMTKERFSDMGKELMEWLKIMGVADRVLRTGELYHRTFKPRVERVLNEAQAALFSNSALPNGHQQGADVQRLSGQHSAVNSNQPSAPQYGQSNGYNSAPYNTAPNDAMHMGGSGQHLSGPGSSAPHPPVYTGPWQYPQASHDVGADAGYHATSNPHSGASYGNAISYHQDAQQQQQPPQISASLATPSNYGTYPQVSNSHNDALLPLGPLGWDDPNTTALWPNTIFMMQQQQEPQQQQQQIQHQSQR